MQPSHKMQEAFALRKNKSYTEALLVYEPLWQENPAPFTDWDGWSYAHCLRQTKQYNKALEVCRMLYKKYPTLEMIASEYAWSIYYTQLAAIKKDTPYPVLHKATTAILQLSTAGGAYSPSIRSVFKLLKHLATAQQIEWKEIGYWLQALPKDKLTTDTYAIDHPSGKKIELASDLEEWYSWQSKYLLQTAQWQAAIQCCDEAAQAIKKWHYSNDIWFKRRKAAALQKLGDKDEAKKMIEEILLRKKEWFLWYDLAMLSEAALDKEKYLIQAALAYGDAEKKIKVYAELALFYKENNQPDHWAHHAVLVYAIRHHQDWPIAKELENELTEAGKLPNKIPAMKELLAPLGTFWKSKYGGSTPAETNRKKQTGTIEKILPHGGAGFIKPAEGGASVYFKVPGPAEDKTWIAGLAVGYELRESFDTKKNKATVMAVKLSAIKKG